MIRKSHYSGQWFVRHPDGGISYFASHKEAIDYFSRVEENAYWEPVP